MPQFSEISRSRLATCDERLQRLCEEAIKHIDFSVLCGHRTQAEQDDAYRKGTSTMRWPHSMHNAFPSLAVDVAPYPIDWIDVARFARLFGYFERLSHELAIPVRWGGDWNRNYRTIDERLIDMPHIELIASSD